MTNACLGEGDNRKLEDLETLKWCPAKHQLSNEQLDEYFAMAKALSLFSRTMQSDEEVSINGDVSGAEDEGEEDISTAVNHQKSVVNSNNIVHSLPTWHSRVSSLDPVLGLKTAILDLVRL